MAREPPCVDGVKVRDQPVFNVPTVVLAIVAFLVAIHGFREYVASDELDGWLLSTFAFVPGRLTFSFDPAGVADVFATFAGSDAAAREGSARYFLGDGSPQWWTLLTYAGLHADWAHCGVNCLWLVAFGSPVARRVGGARFIFLFIVTAVAGAALHGLLHRFDLSPVIGASAAVSGAMAAATRFIFQPGAPLGLGGARGEGGDEPFQRPIMPLARVFTNSRALPFLIMWFGLNLLFGLVSAPLGITQGPVAWEAHVGGFLAGLLLFPLFDAPVARSDRT